MGCVFSQEESDKKRKSHHQQYKVTDSRQIPQKQQKKQQQQQQRSSVNGSNGAQPIAESYTSKAEPVLKLSNGNTELNEDNTEEQFRRQHFDRTSILRHSKKRKKSSVTNSPVVNGGGTTPAATPAKNAHHPNAEATPIKNAQPEATLTPAAILSPTHPALSPQQLQFEIEKLIPTDQVVGQKHSEGPVSMEEPIDVDDVVLDDAPEMTPIADNALPEVPIKAEEPQSASARVAALLAGGLGAVPSSEPTPTANSSTAPTEPTASTSSLELRPLTAATTAFHPEPMTTTTTESVIADEPMDLTAALDAMTNAEDGDSADLTNMSPLPTPPPTPPPIDISAVDQNNVTVTPAATPAKKVSNGGGIPILITSTPIGGKMSASNVSNTSQVNNKSRIPKLASGSAIHPHSKLAKTPSGHSNLGGSNGQAAKTPMSKISNGAVRQTPVSGSGGGQRLRTRRQAAQELEEQQQQRGRFEKNPADENEDCGRLI